MKLPLAVILGATVTTSAAAFAITRGSAASRSGSLLSSLRNNYMGNCQRKMGSSSTSLHASPVEYAKTEISSNDVSCQHFVLNLCIFRLYFDIQLQMSLCYLCLQFRLSSSPKLTAHFAPRRRISSRAWIFPQKLSN